MDIRNDQATTELATTFTKMIPRAALVLFLVIVQVKAAQLSSGNTSLTFEAGRRAPRLVTLTVSDRPRWQNRASEALIDRVEIDGVAQPVEWQLQAGAGTVDGTVVRFIYESRKPHLRLSWEWRSRSSNGPLEHTIQIQNLGVTEIWLPLQDSFRFDFEAAASQPLEQLWVEKGASSPSAEGTHLAPLHDHYDWTGTSSTYAHPKPGNPREIIPYLLVQKPRDDGWYLGIEFSGRTRITLRRRQNTIAGEAGLNPNPGTYRTRLSAGQSFETPTIFLGGFQGDDDDAGNILRSWIREVLNNPATLANTAYPTLVSNSWGSGMAIDDAQAHHMIQDAAGLGLEMFHLDAGWFREIGDWLSNPEKFPHGVASVAAYAHRLGLKFGLWTDWSQVGNAGDATTRDWLTTDPPAGWKPAEFKGVTMDIGVPAAERWASALVQKIVSDFHLDMLEHDGYLVAQGCDRRDHPHAPIAGDGTRRYRDEDFLWVEGSNDTDVSYHATRAYYEIQRRLRKKFPNLMLEICNDGGRMVDFGSAAHGDYFSTSDAYDPIGNRRAFFDASHVLPPAMLESYVEKWAAPRIENFRYMLRSGMMGWFSLMQDSAAWTPRQREEARAEFALYKARLRPLIRKANLYHVSERPDGVRWDGMEYFDMASHAGVLYAFRAATPAEKSHAFKLRGLQRDRSYRIQFHDHSASDYTASGDQLMRGGIKVYAAFPNTSELVFIEQAK